jgi:hypothetical protein
MIGAMRIVRAAAVAAVLVAGTMLAGCATPSGGSTEPPAPTAANETDSPAAAELHAGWLDAGLGVGIVTYGSSTCLPAVDDVEGEGSSITVTIAEPEDKPCTMDYVPRATYVALPAGVDVTQDLTIVLAGALEGSVVLDDDDDLTGTPGDSTDFMPSAGWFDKTGFVVLTWGSSTCVPVVSSVEAAGDDALALAFADLPEDQACSRDMAPRAAVAAVPDGFDAADDVMLTLSGAGVTGTTTILGSH